MTLILSKRYGAKGWTCNRRCPGKSRSASRAYTAHDVFRDLRIALVFTNRKRKSAMRTAADFNLYYAAPDPWHISHARFRDKVLRRRLKPFIRGKSVLELGCGEGHLTQTVFRKARSVVGIDMRRSCSANRETGHSGFKAPISSSVTRGLRRDRGHRMRQLSVPAGAGSVPGESCQEHPGKILLLSGPIVDYRRHFSHKRLMHEFKTLGFAPLRFYNLSVYWHPPSSRIMPA